MTPPPIGTEIFLDSKLLRVEGHFKNLRGEMNVRWVGPNESVGICTPSFWELKTSMAKKQQHDGRAGSPKKSHKFL
jgi:hypothetical protein